MHGERIHEAITVIKPHKAWGLQGLRELWDYRELLWVLGSRDVRVRYKQTVLGASWALLRPLLTMAIFSIVFGRLARMPSDGVPYPLFVCAALLPWTCFSSAVAAAGGSLVGSAALVGKIYFPRLIIPLSSIGSSLVDFVVSLLILLVAMAWYGVGWSMHLLAAPFLMLLLVICALGIGVFLSAATVRYRDFVHISPFMLQTWMYVTPIIFPLSIVPERWRWLVKLNPLTGVVEGCRSTFLGQPFDIPALAYSLSVGLAMLVVGFIYFARMERRFADVI